jgi:hypothetical protein
MNNILEALYFPLRNRNLKMFFGLCFLYLIQYGVQWLPIISLLNIVFLGYIYATQFKIIYTTGNGYNDAPDFPDFSDFFDNILSPLLKVMLIWIFGFLPLILVLWQVEYPSEALSYGLLALGFSYIPLGLMIAAMDDLSEAFNPIVLFQAIRSAKFSYVSMVVTFGLFWIADSYLEEAFAGSWIFSSLIAAYGIMFTARLIGSVYRDRLAEL